MGLPSLSLLSLRPTQRPAEEWRELCGGQLPSFPKWGSTRAKRRFRELVDKSENDKFSAGQYRLPYSNLDIDAVITDGTYSVEHILPRSMVNGRRPGKAEDDWFAWDMAHRTENSRRSNLPLCLWPNLFKTGRVFIKGQLHFNPPDTHRDRLARRWLYARLTYAEIDTLDDPSQAQCEHADEIVELVRTSKMGFAERRLHASLIESVGGRWRNPLCEPDSEGFERALVLARRLAFPAVYF